MTEGLELANSLIKNTCWQDWWKTYQRSIKMDPSSPNFGKVGRTFWRHFLQRNETKIRAQIPDTVAINRKEWMTYNNFRKMYNLVYAAMKKAKIAQNFDVPKILTIARDMSSDPREAYGLPIAVQLTHPEYLVMVNEVGTSKRNVNGLMRQNNL